MILCVLLKLKLKCALSTLISITFIGSWMYFLPYWICGKYLQSLTLKINFQTISKFVKLLLHGNVLYCIKEQFKAGYIIVLASYVYMSLLLITMINFV